MGERNSWSFHLDKSISGLSHIHICPIDFLLSSSKCDTPSSLLSSSICTTKQLPKMASKTSAVADMEPIDVLFALHEKFNLLDFTGPLEVLNGALHDINNSCTWRSMRCRQPFDPLAPSQDCLLTSELPTASKAFDVTIAAAEPKVLCDEGVIIGSQISFKEAHERLEDFDVVVVLGGNTEAILKAKAEPLDLISAYSEIQKKDPTRE